MRSIRDMGRNNIASDNPVRSEADEFAAMYVGKTESELMSSLMQRVSAAKSAGTFSPEQLEDFVRFVSPELNENQRERLAELVKMINGA